ncbi:MAG TPA: PAS domain-containing sensor histidine kinase [Pararhizobium sp.]|uniref:sensor histidine kinase n=1 Tax=Pararhizobium sp. TaxID=1977563 RepID=UPI002B75D05C|nr:PAS domain-containing sensor histidine kinase [Pararhizobium sp.]HTO31087.1 PAS domain-containing sensor histidine kinase [Pararhizobium sp.]
MRSGFTWERLGVAAGGLSIAVSLAVMSLWLLRPAALAKAAPLLFAMQFNTALSFLLTGIAYCLLFSGMPRLAVLPALLTAIFTTLIFFQHPLAVDLNVDRLFITPFFTNNAAHPGRMAPNTAFCFILINAAVIVTACLRRNSNARLICAALVCMISVTALIGYALSITTARDWLPLARMSPQTALCFFSLSTGLIFSGVEKLGYNQTIVAATLAAATYLLLLSLTYVELMRQEVLFTQELPAGENANARTTLLGVLLLSGSVFACLIVYAFRSAENSRRMALQLSESQKRLAAIIDTAVDGFITIDDRGRILSINPACERIFGYCADEMLRQNIRMLMPPPYRDEHDQYLANYRKTGEAKIIGSGREAEGQRKDGSTFPVDLSIARIDLDHQVIYSGVVRDISERKAYERDILDANAELEEFSYRTSHDLRSPIASSLGLIAIADDMIRQGAGVTEVQPVLSRIEQSFRKLDHLIQNIIYLTRTKMLDEPDTSIAVARAVGETVEKLHFTDGGRRTTVHIDIPETMIIHKKLSRFQIILDNLLSNAVKYHDPAEASPEVFVRASTIKGRFVLSVADNGLGIPMENETQLFQMFKRFHPTHAQGSGLGLYILRKSVEHLGGTVAYRRRDKGSIFTVTLPEDNRA